MKFCRVLGGLFYGLIFGSVIACDLMTAGGTSEHENVVQAQPIPDFGDSVQVIVLDSEGKPLPFAVVQAVERKNWAARTQQNLDVVQDAAFIADSVGTFRVEASRCKEIALSANDLGDNVGYQVCTADSTVKLFVKSVRWAFGKTFAHQRVALYGTGFFAESDGGGHWRLPLPEPLQMSDVVVLDRGAWRPVGEHPERLLVEDFEDSLSQFTRLHRFNGGSHWWTAFDSLVETQTKNLAEHRTWVGESFGRALHIDLIPSDGAENPKAMIGFNWGHDSSWPEPGEIYRNLSAADTLFFDAKGSGTLRVQFVCRAEDLLKNSAFETKISLDSVWQKFRLPIEKFEAKSGSSLDATRTWDEVSEHCKATVFAADGAVELWLDNIEIGGVRLSDIE